ncbi:TIGR04290 family methyltransferase [Sphingomonas sp. SRS2]|uniref:TIGR04290 family methyltransferase n=1 Tax=Sphingomonas sp. SRS2 TaxID=133190 RepID=UPI000618434A|nr:TIGR04290 family methyltransferase [Sphingomonas sp. SRS2]KKC24622.1 SAM-dependent methyltransferase [Sphingomonas sp. SRS2]
MSPTELRENIAALGPWFHNIDVRGIWTAPDHFLGDYPGDKFRRFATALPDDLHGKTVLDIGCNAGFYSMEMKRRGAAYVLGIDSDDHYLRQAEFVAEALGYSDIEFGKLSVYDIATLGRRFDLVIFMGVFYHLRHPLLALDLIREHVADDLLVFQSLTRGSAQVAAVKDDYDFNEPDDFDEPGYPKLHFIEHKFADDWTNWWVPNRAASEAMLRSAGFRIEAGPTDEVYVCRIADTPYAGWGPNAGAVYPARGSRK